MEVEVAAVLLFSFVVDAWLGDPDWSFHPIRLIGVAIKKGESWLYREPHAPAIDLLLGAILVVVVVVATYTCSAVVLHVAALPSWWLGQLVTIFLGSFCLARRSLREHAQAVLAPLQAGDLESARSMLARIVSRDTAQLSETEVVRGAVESVAENSSDGVIAPLFYLAVGGVPLAFVYKAINTLDSMLGYRTERYEYFGKVAARLDDIANFLPARLTALALVGAAWVGKQLDYPFDAAAAWRIAWRDGHKHASPNAGYPEAALAGALDVQLGGPSRYFGSMVDKPTLGDAQCSFTPSHILQSLWLLDGASLLALLLCIVGILFC
ncbi:MAG: adenosylcobinamide-phosphate synthase CbiB [Candidatus Binatia bacterium]